ncbi:MAG TPA: alcohol dehydrogenase catalytic domain-containing protein [Phycisphaerae bacterium]|nr:alcohol dehydrogenase catalytic domain-containing protein [Phycisphaerae bacterium]
MKVGMYYNNRDVRVEEMPVPEIGRGDILLKVMASGICGSDLMEFHRIKKAPLVLGHELGGEVLAVGSDAAAFRAGDRIFVTHHVPCDACRECLRGYKTQCGDFKKVNNFVPGGFATHMRVTGRSLRTGAIKLPDDVSYEQGSFIEPLGTVVEAARVLRGDTVLVLGSGVAGILNIQLARAYGAGTIIATDISEYRLRAARSFGADHAIHAGEFSADRLRQVNGGRLADKVIICTGARSAAEMALHCYDQGGEILFFATPRDGEPIEVDWYEHWRNGLTTRMTYGATPEANRTAFELIRHGVVRVDDMISHRLSLDEIGEGFRIASAGKDCLKVIIEPNRP